MGGGDALPPRGSEAGSRAAHQGAHDSRAGTEQRRCLVVGATLDGSIAIADPDGTWKLSLIGVNLTDEIYVITSGGRPFLAAPGNVNGLPAGDDMVFTQNRGRQVFVEASFRF